jgi:hypothetical protein
MNWQAFQEAAPQLARLAAERFAQHGIAFLGTLRQDGYPRISVVEPLLTPEELLLGLLWRSTKAVDLFHDARCTLHSAVTSGEGTEGECKLYGHATEATDPARQADHQRRFRAYWGADAPEAFHVVALDIERAAFVTYDLTGGEMLVARWDPALGLRETRRPYP